MKLKLLVVLELIIVVVSSATSDKDFNFDHAFRNFEDFVVNSNDQLTLEAREAPAGLVGEPIDRIESRMGVAADDRMQEGAEDVGDFDDFLRKLGDLQDQEAVEAKELSQFSSEWEKNIFTPKKRKQISRRKLKKTTNQNSIDRDDGETLVFYETKEPETTTEKKGRKSEDYKKEAINVNKKEFQKKAYPKSDQSHYPKEHRRQSSPGGLQSMMDKARSVVMFNAGNAISSGNVGTYLATMWISNIMQTVGFSALGSMASSAGGRSGYRSKARGRGRSMNFDDEEQEQDEEEGAGFDIKFYTSLMRQVADFADTFHDEL